MTGLWKLDPIGSEGITALLVKFQKVYSLRL